MRKLLFIFPTLKPGGAEHAAIQVANYLVDLGQYSITFLVYDNDTYLSNKIDPRIRVIHAGRHVNTDSRASVWFHYYVNFGLVLHAVINKEHFDDIIAIHEQVPEIAATVAKILSAIFGKRTISRYYSIMATNLSGVHTARSHVTSRMLFAFLSSIRSRVFDGIIVLTEKSKKALAGQSRSIHLIPNPINTQLLQTYQKKAIEGFPAPDTYVLFVARVIRQKNHMMLFRAFQSVCDRLSYNLIAIGQVYDAALNGELMSYIDAHSMADRIVLNGPVKDPLRYLVNAKAIVLVSEYEGLPMSLLEAMALNVPIITTQYDGSEDYFSARNATVIRRGSEQELAEALLAIDAGGPVIEERTKQAFEDSRQFDIKTIGSRYHHLFSGDAQ
jgi:glycosyltransferase involved in cell wall biosynthesis